MTKCFFCSNDAVLRGYTCSPTSSTGITPVRPYCSDCSIEVKPTIVEKLVDHDTFCCAFRDAYDKKGIMSQYHNYEPKKRMFKK